MAVRLYIIPKDSRKTYNEGKNPEEKTITKLEGTTRTKANATIKLKMRV